MGHLMQTNIKHIITGDLYIIKSNFVRKLFTEVPKFRGRKLINFDKAKSCVLTGLEECTQEWCKKNSVNKFFFSELTNNITTKVDDRINVLNENLHHQLLGLY